VAGLNVVCWPVRGRAESKRGAGVGSARGMCSAEGGVAGGTEERGGSVAGGGVVTLGGGDEIWVGVEVSACSLEETCANPLS
jgi:hypothetical protein